MAVITMGSLGALIAWTQARVDDKGVVVIPAGDPKRLADFRAHVAKCPEVLECSVTSMPGSPFAYARLTLRDGAKLPVMADRAS